MKIYGLIGYPLTHSFSPGFFYRKFLSEHLTDHFYELFPLTSVSELPSLIAAVPALRGFNVTIPYKKQVIPFLHHTDPLVQKTGAVNTVRINENRELEGFNTDVEGFTGSLLRHYTPREGKALVLGNGGASLAVQAGLEQLNIPFTVVSRQPGYLSYADLTRDIMNSHPLIINSTSLGMYPEENTFPPIPYEHIGPAHFLFDLVYNPSETLFLTKGKAKGARILNGLEMLHLQAEAAWKIWNYKN